MRIVGSAGTPGQILETPSPPTCRSCSRSNSSLSSAGKRPGRSHRSCADPPAPIGPGRRCQPLLRRRDPGRRNHLEFGILPPGEEVSLQELRAQRLRQRHHPGAVAGVAQVRIVVQVRARNKSGSGTGIRKLKGNTGNIGLLAHPEKYRHGRLMSAAGRPSRPAVPVVVNTHSPAGSAGTSIVVRLYRLAVILLHQSFLGRFKTAVRKPARAVPFVDHGRWTSAHSLKPSGLCSLTRQLLRGGSATGSLTQAGGTASQSSATRYPLAHDVPAPRPGIRT